MEYGIYQNFLLMNGVGIKCYLIQKSQLENLE